MSVSFQKPKTRMFCKTVSYHLFWKILIPWCNTAILFGSHHLVRKNMQYYNISPLGWEEQNWWKRLQMKGQASLPFLLMLQIWKKISSLLLAENSPYIREVPFWEVVCSNGHCPNSVRPSQKQNRSYPFNVHSEHPPQVFILHPPHRTLHCPAGRGQPLLLRHFQDN